METTNGFRGNYWFLSNFYPAIAYLDGWEFPTSEHAFQAAKTLDKDWRKTIQNAESPKKAKHYGYKVPMRPEWEEQKVDYMRIVVRSKFIHNPDLEQQLVDTGSITLIEYNEWNDKIWGVCNGEGKNHLGRILMELREEFNG